MTATLMFSMIQVADRWLISDFAFPSFPGSSFWQCIGVSQTNDPVSGGWFLYALQVDPAQPDIPRRLSQVRDCGTLAGPSSKRLFPDDELV